MRRVESISGAGNLGPTERPESCVVLISNPSCLDWLQRHWFCAELGFYPRDCIPQGGLYQGHRWVSAGLWDCIVERLVRTPCELHQAAQEGEGEPTSPSTGHTHHLQQETVCFSLVKSRNSLPHPHSAVLRGMQSCSELDIPSLGPGGSAQPPPVDWDSNILNLFKLIVQYCSCKSGDSFDQYLSAQGN